MVGTSARPLRLPFCCPPPWRELGAEGLRFPWRHSPIPREATVWAPKMAASEGWRPFCAGLGPDGGQGGGRQREGEGGDRSFLSSLGESGSGDSSVKLLSLHPLLPQGKDIHTDV